MAISVPMIDHCDAHGGRRADFGTHLRAGFGGAQMVALLGKSPGLDQYYRGAPADWPSPFHMPAVTDVTFGCGVIASVADDRHSVPGTPFEEE